MFGCVCLGMSLDVCLGVCLGVFVYDVNVDG